MVASARGWHRWAWMASAALMLYALKLTNALTPGLAAGLGLAAGALAWFEGSRRPGWRALRIGSFGLAVAAAGAVAAVEWSGVTRLLGRDPTLTRRTELWDLLIPEIAQRPWFGHGFMAFWRHPTAAATVRANYPIEPFHAHNGWVELALHLGLVGAVLLTVALVVALVRAVARIDRPGVAPAVAVLVFEGAYNLAEVSLMLPEPPGAFHWALTVGAMAWIGGAERREAG